MSFEELLASRSAEVYSDFLLPHLTARARLLDCGCGAGSITVGLAGLVRWIVGLEVCVGTLVPGAEHVAAESISNVRFVAGDGSRLPFSAGSFDAVLMHSVLEAASDPASLVREALRVLVPSGLLAAASVDYGGRILAGPHGNLLDRFYAVRERLWALDGIARPRSGRDLRRLLHDGGFTAIEATAHYLSYGTPEAVRRFGEARARDCEEPWFTTRAVAHGILSEAELGETRRAWEEWSRAPDSFLAFAWCRVIGRKPSSAAAG